MVYSDQADQPSQWRADPRGRIRGGVLAAVVETQPAASLQFRLVDQATGEPLVGYSFWLLQPLVKARERLATDDRGKVVIPAIIPGEPIGTALLEARRTVRAARSIDWANYIHYGAPDFRVKRLEAG